MIATPAIGLLLANIVDLRIYKSFNLSGKICVKSASKGAVVDFSGEHENTTTANLTKAGSRYGLLSLYSWKCREGRGMVRIRESSYIVASA